MANLNLFSCKTFHHFLISAIENNTDLKRGGKKAIAEYLNIHPSLLSQILNGSRAFTDEQVFLLSEHLGLTDLESDYVLLLHQLETTQNKRFKERLNKKLGELKGRSSNIGERLVKERILTDQEKSVFYSSWQYSGVRMFTTLEGGRTREEICESLELDKKNVSEILDFLVKTGLCRQEKGRYFHHVSRTHVEKDSPYYKQHHVNWRIKSIQTMDRRNNENLCFTAPLSVSEEDFQLLKEEMMALIQKVSTVVKDSPAENVYCICMDFFKV